MRLKNFVILLAMAILAIPAHAQMKVSGVVVQADDGEPVIGATIKVKGSPAIGTATDIDGKFTTSRGRSDRYAEDGQAYVYRSDHAD